MLLEGINRTVTQGLHLHDSDAIPVGGRLLHFQSAWRSSNTDAWTLEIVSQEYAKSFSSYPHIV